MEKILVVATHPDDETFGAGGLMLKKKSEGKEVVVLNLTHMSKEYGYSEKQVLTREKEIEQMVSAYGLNGYFNLKLRPAHLETYSRGELIGRISEIFSAVQPDTVILPYKNDIHSDHRIAFECCYACTKSFRYPFIKKIMMMETPSETDFAIPQEAFSPNFFVDITGFLEEKIRIANLFRSEVLEHPFPRSIKNIKAYATIRGAVIGTDSAEAFEIIKIIDK